MIIVLGPGRCGTTFMIRLLAELGMDTGGYLEIFREEKEIDLDFNWPNVIKGTGALSLTLNNKIDKYNWQVEHIIFCVRNFEPLLQSHLKWKRGKGVYKKYLTEYDFEQALREELPKTVGTALLQILEREHPYTVAHFPKIASDVDYCHSVVRSVLDVTREDFERAWSALVNPNKIHFT